MSPDEIIDHVCDLNPKAVLVDGFNDCIVGFASRIGIDPVVAYDIDAVLDKLVAQGMSEEEAIEHFDFNIIGAWVGDGTPIFVSVLRNSSKG